MAATITMGSTLSISSQDHPISETGTSIGFEKHLKWRRIKMIPTYLHCPKCNDLDRHFIDAEDSDVYCQKCLKISPISALIEPEVTDEWVAQALGSEISIVQKKDLHGRISCGWFSSTKIIIAEAAVYGFKGTSPVFDALFKLAEDEAAKRNKQQTENQNEQS